MSRGITVTLVVPGHVHHDRHIVTPIVCTRRSLQVIGAGQAPISGETTVTTGSHRAMILGARLPQIERYRQRSDLAAAARRPGRAESTPSSAITNAAEWSVPPLQSQGTRTLSSNDPSGDLAPHPLPHRDFPNRMQTTELHGWPLCRPVLSPCRLRGRNVWLRCWRKRRRSWPRRMKSGRRV